MAADALRPAHSGRNALSPSHISREQELHIYGSQAIRRGFLCGNPDLLHNHADHEHQEDTS